MSDNVKYPAERLSVALKSRQESHGSCEPVTQASMGHCAVHMAVTTTGLSKRYGDTRVVDSVDLAVPEHTVYSFLGPNGAGKSTTMKMLLGLVHPTEGSATVLGTPLTPENRLEVLRHVGSLIESPSSYFGLLSTVGMSYDYATEVITWSTVAWPVGYFAVIVLVTVAAFALSLRAFARKEL